MRDQTEFFYTLVRSIYQSCKIDMSFKEKEQLVAKIRQYILALLPSDACAMGLNFHMELKPQSNFTRVYFRPGLPGLSVYSRFSKPSTGCQNTFCEIMAFFDLNGVHTEVFLTMEALDNSTSLQWALAREAWQKTYPQYSLSDPPS